MGMQRHVKILAILHIILGGLGVLAAAVIMAVFGGVAKFVDLSELSQDGMMGSAIVGLIAVKRRNARCKVYPSSFCAVRR